MLGIHYDIRTVLSWVWAGKAITPGSWAANECKEIADNILMNTQP